jgi:GNAT superfamily N-acetyltransferase
MCRPAEPRPLVADEADAIATLIRHAFCRLSVEPDPPPSARRESPDVVRAILEAGGGAGIDADGWLVACVLWQPKPPGLYMGRLAVDPAHRGRGHARRLVAAAERAAREGGHGVLWLSTRLVLEDNRSLFASCGFIEGERHAHPGYTQPTFVDMAKVIG